jgi:hypothetical protein
MALTVHVKSQVNGRTVPTAKGLTFVIPLDYRGSRLLPTFASLRVVFLMWHRRGDPSAKGGS